MKFIVQSTAVWDSISFPGGGEAREAPGGAGFYALAGMKVWEDDVAIVTGVGADYLDRFGKWYQDNSITTAGLMVKDPHTPRTLVCYDGDGERVEKPFFGPAHYRSMEARPEEIGQFCGGCEGVYVFKNLDPAYWDGLLALKRKYGFAQMWEIAANVTVPENLSKIREIAEQADVFSINKTEAKSMFGAEDETELIRRFQQWQIPLVYLRLGSRGVCLIRGGSAVFVPSVPDAQVVDATGGGNSSSGGALIGYCRGCSLEEIGAMGNVSASFCIAQWGAPERFDAALRAEAERRLGKVLSLTAELD